MGEATPLERAMIAFGGVWAQGLLAAATCACAALTPARSAMATDLVEMFTRYNLYNAAFNLIPMRPLDGAEAWKLFPLLWKRARRSGRRRQKARDRAELNAIEGELQDLLRRAARQSDDEKK
jgi:Zn-dependent protease